MSFDLFILTFRLVGGVGVLLGPFKNCVSLSSIRGDWSSFQLAIIKHRLDLMCIDIAPSAKIFNCGSAGMEDYLAILKELWLWVDPAPGLFLKIYYTVDLDCAS